MRLLSFFMTFFVSVVQADETPKVSKTVKKSPKVQEVNFEEMALSGQIRSPQGAYLLQKNGIRFLPLYDVKKSVDGKIRESSEWLR